MKFTDRYVVAFISFFDNVIYQKEVEAESELEAACIYLKDKDLNFPLPETMAELHFQCFDADCMISVHLIVEQYEPQTI